MTLLYPRLPMSEARALATRIIDEDVTPEQAAHMAATSHPRAAPIATGGAPATAMHLTQLRRDVLADIAALGRRVSDRELDIVMGRSLHSRMECSRADAGSPGVWSFMNLVLLPDLALRRFPHPKLDRLVGAGARSALRRVWLRHDIFGDLLSAGDGRLREDELVGLTERTSMLRNRRLVVAAAREALSRPDRIEAWSREFFKQVRWATGPRLLDVLPESALRQCVHEIAESIPGTGSTALVEPHDATDDKSDGEDTTQLESVVVTTQVLGKYSRTHGVSLEEASRELREMIADFGVASRRWRNTKGIEAIGRDQFMLQFSADGRSFVNYSAGAGGFSWRQHKMRRT